MARRSGARESRVPNRGRRAATTGFRAAANEGLRGVRHRVPTSGDRVEFTFMIRLAGLILVGGVLAAALGVPTPVSAQTAATPSVQPPAGSNTTGTVVDISGAVVPGAEVVVTAPDGRSVTVRTDADGTFNAGMMASRVRVASEGFETADIPVSGPGAV